MSWHVCVAIPPSGMGVVGVAYQGDRIELKEILVNFSELGKRVQEKARQVLAPVSIVT